MTTTWTVVRVFSVYEEAASYKSALELSTEGAILQVKIARQKNNLGEEVFVVKYRTDPDLVDAVKEVEEKMSSFKSKQQRGQ